MTTAALWRLYPERLDYAACQTGRCRIDALEVARAAYRELVTRGVLSAAHHLEV